MKAAIADGSAKRLTDVPPDVDEPVGRRVIETLTSLGWQPPDAEGGFSAGQPAFVFQVPLGGRSEDELLAGFNQLWRRNIKKAAKLGVDVSARRRRRPARVPRALSRDRDARRFHRPSAVVLPADVVGDAAPKTPTGSGSTLRAMRATWSRRRLWCRSGEHAWYSYGASSTEKRDVRGSNAIQWQMMRDSAAAGATVYDLRGITDTLDSEDSHFGLIQFKLGTGGEAVEYVGEWDLPLNRLLYKAFDVYMSRR